MYHVMDADGVRQDAEWERMKELLSESYGVTGEELDRLVAAGGEADQDAVDLYAFTSVLKRHLDEEARVEFIGIMWEIVFADGELHELEDHTLWRVAELIGVDRRDRILARQEAQTPGAGRDRQIDGRRLSIHAAAGTGQAEDPDRAASGTVEPRPRRSSAPGKRLRPRHQAAAARRRTAGDARAVMPARWCSAGR